MKKTHKRIQPNRVPKHFEKAMQLLYSLFEPFCKIPYRNRARDQMYLPAKEAFDKFWALCEKDQVEIGFKTFCRAKRALGIKSKRIGGIPREKGAKMQYIWLLPTKTPEQIINVIRLNKERAIKAREEEQESLYSQRQDPMNHWAVIELKQFMVSSSCFCRASEVREYWKQVHGTGKRTLSAAKKTLEIVSLKKGEVWYWVYPSDSVRNWLAARLEHGPVPVETLTREAEEAGWGYDVLHQAKLLLGNVHDLFTFNRKSERVRNWFDATVNPDLLQSEGEDEDSADAAQEI